MLCKCKNVRKKTGKVCGHKWIPRVIDGKPDICPECKSKNWETGKKPKNEVKDGCYNT